jgi:malonate decarboxylase gamma subunit
LLVSREELNSTDEHCYDLIEEIDADAPWALRVEKVKERIAAAIANIRQSPGDLTSRLNIDEATGSRAASIEVLKRLAEQWSVF